MAVRKVTDRLCERVPPFAERCGSACRRPVPRWIMMSSNRVYLFLAAKVEPWHADTKPQIRSHRTHVPQRRGRATRHPGPDK